MKTSYAIKAGIIYEFHMASWKNIYFSYEKGWNLNQRLNGHPDHVLWTKCAKTKFCGHKTSVGSVRPEKITPCLFNIVFKTMNIVN